jgi:hypothetical protein
MKKLIVLLFVILPGCVLRPADDCSYTAGDDCSYYEQPVPRSSSTAPRYYPASSPVITEQAYITGRVVRVLSGSEVLLDVAGQFVLVHLEGVQDTVYNEQQLQGWRERVFEVRVLTRLSSSEWVVYLYDDSGGQVNYLLE